MRWPWLIALALLAWLALDTPDEPQRATFSAAPLPLVADDGVHNVVRTFAGDECTDDCSGHRAGYEWAEARDIDDPDTCDGNSDSFIEGCRAYAEGREPEETESER